MGTENFGIDPTRMLAGFCGGAVHAFVFRQTDPYTVASSIVVGTLTANYLGAAAGNYIGTWIGVQGASFVTGLVAMIVCQAIVSAAKAWKPRTNGGEK
jgi:predicted MFS family arabinose efflux permease